MFYINVKERKSLDAKIQAPFVMAEIRALRSSIFKSSPEVQRALAIAASVEQKYDLSRADLFIPALETFCAILDPLSGSLLSGTVRRVGYEMFPQFVSIQGIPAASVKTVMGIKDAADVVRMVSNNYAGCVVGPDAGTLACTETNSGITITDTTIVPCQLQIGVYFGAGKLTGLFRENALVERKCRGKGDATCTYDFMF